MNKQWDAWPEVEMNGGFCGLMARPGMVFKTIAWMIIFTFVWHAGLPLAHATADDKLPPPPVNQAAAPSAAQGTVEEDDFTEALEEIESKIAKISSKLIGGEDDAIEQEDLKKLEKKIRKLSIQLERKFMDEENELIAKQLPQVIMDRQAAMVQRYRTNLATMLANIQAIGLAATPAEKKTHADRAKKHLDDNKHHRKSDFDPHKLPNDSDEPDELNKPRETKEEYTLSGYISSPMALIAANGGFSYKQLAGASDPAYLAESIEVKLTPNIVSLAAALNHDPVLIHNWVRNYVEWIPTWGAMQNSDHTLSTLKGNAMDIASLTIALLRASGIPSRYVHGTVDVPAAKMMNWAGGFTDDIAASTHIASGGIPTTRMTRGGTTHQYRIEHVWVQAAVDYYPSRAAKNRDADSWVDMDTSFKQYDHAAVASTVAYDAYGFVNQTQVALSSADPYTIANFFNERNTQLDLWINNNMIPDVYDTPIVELHLPHLASGLPYDLVTRGATYGALPKQLSYQIDLTFQTIAQNGVVTDGVPVHFSMAEVNNDKITVSFRPETAADEAALMSLVPGGQITDLSLLPKSVPAYLIRVVPELRVNGVILMEGVAVDLGSDIKIDVAITYPTKAPRHYNSTLTTGGFYDVSIMGGSYDHWRGVDVLAGYIEDTYTWSQGDLLTATKERMKGALFYTGFNTYWSEYLQLVDIQAKVSNSKVLLMPSFGVYGVKPSVGYVFGVPTTVRDGGVIMDIPHIGSVVTELHSATPTKPYISLTNGIIASMLEHSVPEQMFASPANGSEGRSAIKAIAAASQQGVPVLYINQANLGVELPKLQLNANTIADIQSAVLAGKDVITTQSKITLVGWLGAGYIMYDPIKGGAAYMISGRLNGGGITIDDALVISVIIELVSLIPFVRAAVLAARAVKLVAAAMKARRAKAAAAAAKGCFVATTLIHTLRGLIEIRSVTLGTVVR